MSHSAPLVTSFDVRFCETDALQHVSNTALVTWFEAAREPIFRMFTPELDLNNWPLI
ncbi:MAG: acyl-CoA thioesterase, partial [Pseudomonadota bacterium]|nr:acyl-CoA thioesterase [Pseudomonadota bacterium]